MTQITLWLKQRFLIIALELKILEVLAGPAELRRLASELLRP